MPTTKVFKFGNSQAIRLPKEFRFNTNEVEIFRRGDEVVLRERSRTAAEILAIFESFSEVTFRWACVTWSSVLE